MSDIVKLVFRLQTNDVGLDYQKSNLDKMNATLKTQWIHYLDMNDGLNQNVINQIIKQGKRVEIGGYKHGDNLAKLHQRNYLIGTILISYYTYSISFRRMQNTIDFQIIEKRKTKSRKVKAWSQNQDKMLKKLYQQFPRQWAVIASLIPDRNQNQCLHRYRRLCQRGMNHNKNWSEEEDNVVQKLMKKAGKNWKLISEMLGSKTGKQIRERYINKLDPSIKKHPWTKQQDIILIKCIKQFGSRWSQISKSIPGRPQNMIKNRFYSYIKKNYQIRDKPKEQTSAQIILCHTNVSQNQRVEKDERVGQQIPHIPSILQLEQQTPILKQIQNIEMVDLKTFNHLSQQDLFFFLNAR